MNNIACFMRRPGKKQTKNVCGEKGIGEDEAHGGEAPVIARRDAEKDVSGTQSERRRESSRLYDEVSLGKGHLQTFAENQHSEEDLRFGHLMATLLFDPRQVT